MASHFVRPETARLPVGDGEYLIVKKRLSAGEQRAVFQRCAKGETVLTERGIEGGVTIDAFLVGRSTVVGYLIDWNFTDDAGEPVPIRGLPVAELEAALDALDQDTYNEVVRVVQGHEKAMNAERAAQKKTPGGGPESPAIWPLPAGADGGMSG